MTEEFAYTAIAIGMSAVSTHPPTRGEHKSRVTMDILQIQTGATVEQSNHNTEPPIETRSHQHGLALWMSTKTAFERAGEAGGGYGSWLSGAPWLQL